MCILRSLRCLQSVRRLRSLRQFYTYIYGEVPFLAAGFATLSESKLDDESTKAVEDIKSVTISGPSVAEVYLGVRDSGWERVGVDDNGSWTIEEVEGGSSVEVEADSSVEVVDVV